MPLHLGSSFRSHWFSSPRRGCRDGAGGWFRRGCRLLDIISRLAATLSSSAKRPAAVAPAWLACKEGGVAPRVFQCRCHRRWPYLGLKLAAEQVRLHRTVPDSMTTAPRLTFTEPEEGAVTHTRPRPRSVSRPPPPPAPPPGLAPVPYSCSSSEPLLAGCCWACRCCCGRLAGSRPTLYPRVHVPRGSCGCGCAVRPTAYSLGDQSRPTERVARWMLGG